MYELYNVCFIGFVVHFSNSSSSRNPTCTFTSSFRFHLLFFVLKFSHRDLSCIVLSSWHLVVHVVYTYIFCNRKQTKFLHTVFNARKHPAGNSCRWRCLCDVQWRRSNVWSREERGEYQKDYCLESSCSHRQDWRACDLQSNTVARYE